MLIAARAKTDATMGEGVREFKDRLGSH